MSTIGAIAATGHDFRALARRRMSAKLHDEFRVVDAERGIRRNFTRRCPQKQIAAGGIAHRVARHEAGLHFAAAGLDLEARIVDLRSCRAGGNDCPPHPADRLAGAQQSADREGLSHLATWRMKIDRPLGIFYATQKLAHAQGRASVHGTFDRAIQRSQPCPQEFASPFAR